MFKKGVRLRKQSEPSKVFSAGILLFTFAAAMNTAGHLCATAKETH